MCSWSPWCRCRPKRVPCHQTPACKQSPGNQIWEGSKIAQSRIQYILYNLSWCSLPPSWKDLRQGWHSLACTGRWQPREPWTQPEISLSLTAQLEPTLLSRNLLAYCSSKASANPAMSVEFLCQTKVNQLHSIVLPVNNQVTILTSLNQCRVSTFM